MPARVLNGRRRRGATILLLLVVGAFSSCAPAMRSTATGPVTATHLAELWVPPADLAARDLFHGPGGPELAPHEDATFHFKKLDVTGYSGGYDVIDDRGLEWSVKQGLEVQSEIAASRLLWAVGYHQPPMYLVRHWRLADGPQPGGKPAGRFRPDLPNAKKVADWSWQQNPFVGTRPFRGLLVFNLLINNWDLKSTNNKIYRVSDPGDGPGRRFVVRDLGAAFGKSRRFPHGTRNNLLDFESQGFVTGVKDGRVQFDYRGRHRELLANLTPGDVVWACELASRLTDRQLDDAFRAAGYGPVERGRFTGKLKEKIARGLALRDAPAARRE
jgi:hypothetical protein